MQLVTITQFSSFEILDNFLQPDYCNVIYEGNVFDHSASPPVLQVRSSMFDRFEYETNFKFLFSF